MEIKKVPNDVVEDVDVPDGARTFSRVDLSSNTYGSEIQDISILQGMGKRKGEPSTDAGKFTLLSIWGELMRIARITRPDALRDASVSDETSITTDGWVINPIDFEEIVDVNSTKSNGDTKHNHIQGVDEVALGYSGNVNRLNLLQTI